MNRASIALLALTIILIVSIFTNVMFWKQNRVLQQEIAAASSKNVVLQQENSALSHLNDQRLNALSQGLSELTKTQEQLIQEITETKQALADVQANMRQMQRVSNMQICQGTTYKVKRGDTLWDLSRHYYENPLFYPKLAEVNHIPGPDFWIYADSGICLPGVWETDKYSAKVTEAKTEHSEPTAAAAAMTAIVKEPESVKVDELMMYSAGVSAEIQDTSKQEINALPHPMVSEHKEMYLRLLPGSMWSIGGNLSPVEEGNFLNYSYVEQGFTLWRGKRTSLVPYVALNVSFDSEGYDWNNRLASQVGLKFVHTRDRGIFQFGAAYIDEYRPRSGLRKGHISPFGNYWAGWDMPTSDSSSSRRPFSAFPGSSWGTVGATAPTEGGNILGTMYLQQGITVAKVAGASLIPFGEHTVSFDSKGFTWNNRQIFGGGFKVATPFNSGILEFGAVYKHEWRWKDQLRADGVSGFVNLWYGWSPPR